MAKPTIGELLAGKGTRQLTMTNATDFNTALAAAEAGIDIIMGRGMYDEQQIGLVLDQIVKAAPNAVIACNLPATVAYVSDSEAIRAAMIARDHGADIVYSSGNTLSRFEAMASVGIIFGGHVGLVPIRASREGGLGARGKTLDEAVRIYEETLAYQRAGAVIVEMECVAADIAAEISKRVDILVCRSGAGRDAMGSSCSVPTCWAPRSPATRAWASPTRDRCHDTRSATPTLRGGETGVRRGSRPKSRAATFRRRAHIRVDPMVVEAFREAAGRAHLPD